MFVLDEYCARYGVRGCHRHLSYLTDLLDRAEAGIMIDPTLLHYSFAFCASHVHGNRFVALTANCTLKTRGFGPNKLLQRLLDMLPGTGKKWPIADRRVSSDNPRNNFGTYFGSSSLLGFKAANSVLVHLLQFTFNQFCR